MKFRSLVHGLRGIVWFWVEFWTGILLQHSVQSMGIYSMRQAQMGKSALPLELFLSLWNLKSAGVSQGTQWTGWDVQVKQVRQVRRGSFWDYIIAHGRDFILNSLSYWKPVQLSQEWWSMSAFRGLENESGRTILNLLKFSDELLGHSWQKSYSSQDIYH